ALVLTLLAGAAYAQAPQEAAPAPAKPAPASKGKQPAQATPAKPAQPTPAQAAPAAAATPAASPAATTTAAAVPTVPVPGGITPPPGYLIGAEDVLSIVFWKDKDMTTDVAVRPDGKISLSLINEVSAAGLTPDQLRERLTEESKKYMEDANITVVVKQINS